MHGDESHPGSLNERPVDGTIDVASAWELFTTPPARPASGEERRILESAESFALSYPEERMEGRPCELAGYRWGVGPTVFLAHGWGGRGAQLGSFVEPLVERGYRVVTVDAPGHGLSEGTRTNIYEFAGSARAVIDAYGPLHAVVGHSLGAAAAAMIAREGSPVGRLVLIASIVSLVNEVDQFAQRVSLPAEVDRGMREYMERSFEGDIWKDTALREIAPSIDAPTLIIHDRHDPRVRFEDSEDLASVWTGSQLHVTTGLGHLAPVRSREVAERAVAFVTGEASEG